MLCTSQGVSLIVWFPPLQQRHALLSERYPTHYRLHSPFAPSSATLDSGLLILRATKSSMVQSSNDATWIAAPIPEAPPRLLPDSLQNKPAKDRLMHYKIAIRHMLDNEDAVSWHPIWLNERRSYRSLVPQSLQRVFTAWNDRRSILSPL